MPGDPLLNAYRRKQAAYEGAGQSDLADKQAKAIRAREKALNAETEADEVDQYHTGGGWYEIDGVKVQGKEAAREALGG